jgi:hypothetical protein
VVSAINMLQMLEISGLSGRGRSRGICDLIEDDGLLFEPERRQSAVG